MTVIDVRPLARARDALEAGDHRLAVLRVLPRDSQLLPGTTAAGPSSATTTLAQPAPVPVAVLEGYVNDAETRESLADVKLTIQDWKTRDPAEVIPDLLGIKGVGPYTANLAVNLSYGRGGTAHVDTYVTNVIGTLYLNNPNASPEQVAQFIDHRWGAYGEAVLDLLTTDTEVWTAELGVTVGVRSGARA